MFDIHRVQLDWGGRKLTLETGRFARQADGAVFATYGDTTVLATVVAAQAAEGRHRLPSADLQLPGKILRRRPHSRRLFQARGAADRKGNADFAADRPSDPSAVRRRLALRHAGHRERAVARPRERSRHSGDGCGVRGADAVGRAVHGTDRRRPRRLHQQRVCAQPADRRDGREPARSRRRRHPGCGADGGIGSQGALRGHHAWRRDVRPPAFPAGDRRHHPAGGEGGEGAARIDSGRQCGARKGNARSGREGAAHRVCDPRQDGAPQGSRRRERPRHGSFRAARCREPEISEAPGRRRIQRARSQDRALEYSRHRHAHRRPRREDRAPDRLRSRRAAAHPRLGAVHPRRDAGAGGVDARHRRRRAIRRRAAGNLQGNLPAALQLPALLGRRNRPPRRSGTARNRPRQARLARHSSGAAAAHGISLHDPRRLRDHRVRTARPRWRRSAARRCR